MDYRRFENTIVARIDKGEEILEKIEKIAKKENIEYVYNWLWDMQNKWKMSFREKWKRKI